MNVNVVQGDCLGIMAELNESGFLIEQEADYVDMIAHRLNA